MVPIIGVIGGSGAGKTELVVGLIKEIKQRGFKVAAIKHTVHDVKMDREGKDSERMSRAGADAVALAAPGGIAVHLGNPGQWTPEHIAAKLFPRTDLVLVEGFKEARTPKIAVVTDPEEMPTAKGIIAIVSEHEIETPLPLLKPGQVSEMADLVQKYVERMTAKRDVKLFINGQSVFIKPFIKDFFLNTIAAMVASLKGTGAARRIQVLIDKPPEKE